MTSPTNPPVTVSHFCVLAARDGVKIQCFVPKVRGELLIERSINRFDTFGDLPAQPIPADGNFTWIDASPKERLRTYYYRVRTRSADGAVGRYSGVISVENLLAYFSLPNF